MSYDNLTHMCIYHQRYCANSPTEHLPNEFTSLVNVNKTVIIDELLFPGYYITKKERYRAAMRLQNIFDSFHRCTFVYD